MATDNPYKTPSAAVRDRVFAGPAGGTLQDGIGGNYDFEIMDVIKEGWQRQSGLKGAFWLGFLLMYLVMIGVGLAAGMVSAVMLTSGGQTTEPSAGIAVAQLVFQVVIMAIMYPMYAGLFMMGIYRSVDLPVKASMVFGYFGVMVTIFFTMLLVTIFSVLGFMLLVIPGIYLSVAYSMAIPLIAEKKLGIWAAMEASRRAVSKHWFKYFFTYLLMGLIVMVSFLVIIGWIWTAPMMIAVVGILYRITYGVEDAREAVDMGQATPVPAQA